MDMIEELRKLAKVLSELDPQIQKAFEEALKAEASSSEFRENGVLVYSRGPLVFEWRDSVAHWLLGETDGVWFSSVKIPSLGLEGRSTSAIAGPGFPEAIEFEKGHSPVELSPETHDLVAEVVRANDPTMFDFGIERLARLIVEGRGGKKKFLEFLERKNIEPEEVFFYPYIK